MSLISIIEKLTLKHRVAILVFFDVLASIVTLCAAFFLKYPLSEVFDRMAEFRLFLPLFVVIRIGTFFNYDMYVYLWRYASVNELLSILKAITLSSLYAFALLFLTNGVHFPSSIILIDWALNILFVGGVRICLRIYRDYVYQKKNRPPEEVKVPVLIVGAGDAGEMIAREILRSAHHKYTIVGFLDDNLHLKGRIIHQLQVLGTTEKLPEFVKQHDVQEVIIAIPSANGEQIRRIVEKCEKSEVKAVKITPALSAIIDGRVSINQLREVRIEDLLGRDVVETDMSLISEYVAGSTVLVTGAGGSIGSELCRQLIRFIPKELVLVDHAESSVYHIDMELRLRKPENSMVSPFVVDVKDIEALKSIFKKKMPTIVFHAAAYKHVPLMEANVSSVILNNIFGTRNVLELCAKNQVKKCVLISSDKAVEPSNCMGATKRMGEVLMQIYASKFPKTKFVAVRFGNVLGSEGSVVPLFQKQIQSGGPITITHPEITRFFMTITEAVSLVIDAGAFCEGGEIFVLDMGQPVKILQLAKDLIHLSGLDEKQIRIEFIGLRPGEKLYEELFFAGEAHAQSQHKKIFVVRSKSFDYSEVESRVDVLISDANKMSPEEVRKALFDCVDLTRPKQ